MLTLNTLFSCWGCPSPWLPEEHNNICTPWIPACSGFLEDAFFFIVDFRDGRTLEVGPLLCGAHAVKGHWYQFSLNRMWLLLTEALLLKTAATPSFDIPQASHSPSCLLRNRIHFWITKIISNQKTRSARIRKGRKTQQIQQEEC